MRFPAVILAAAALLLAACSSSEQPASTAGSTGGSTPPAASGGTTAQPAAPSIRPGSKEDFVANVGDRVFFGYDKSDLTPEARNQIQKWAAWLKQYPNNTVTIEGHCDERGTREYNLGLG